MERNLKIFLAVLVILIIAVPAGLIASGTAFGEWGPDDLQQMLGYVPAGFNQLAGLWHAPLQDYDLPGQHDTPLSQTPGYYTSAIVGAALSCGAMYVIAKAMVKRRD